MKRLKSLLFFVLILLISGFSNAQENQILFKEKLEFAVSQTMKSFNIPGLAIGIVQNNEIIYANGFGMKNIETKEPVTKKSIFHLASTSKPFSATAIMQLVEKGKVFLDEPVVKYLPYFKMADKQYKEIIVRQLLNHTSGLTTVDNFNWDKPEYDDGALERFTRSLSTRILSAAPGDRFIYSNDSFDVAGDLIAKVSGMSFEEYIKKNILDPLGMYESTFLKNEVSPELATTPHIRDEKNFDIVRLYTSVVVSNIYPYNRAHAPCSTLHSNVMEMCNWAIANMNRGIFKGKRILRSSSYDILWAPATLNNGKKTNVGLSWFIGEHNENRTISHQGADPGFTSYFVMLPEKSIAVIGLCNCHFAPITEITFMVLDIVLGLEPRLPKRPIHYLMAETMTEKGIEAAVNQFYELKNEYSHINSFEDLLNNFGYSLLALKMVKEAIGIFKLNVKEYPESANCYDSLGEAYMINGDKELAIKNYEKALDLNPRMESAINALKILREKK